MGLNVDTTVPADSPSARFNRACLIAAFAITLVWGCVYTWFARDLLCDEAGHLAAVDHLALGKPGLPETMPMMPGYHWTVVAIGLGSPTIATARFTSTLFALSGLAAFAIAWAALHRRPAGPATLLLALLPILQPFNGMAYSDAAGAATLLWAACAQVTGHRLLAAMLFAVSAYVRQTNLIWVGFFFLWELRDHLADLPRVRFRSLLVDAWQRCRWLALLTVIATGVVLWAGRLTPGTVHGNALQPNGATLHFAGWLFLLLVMPAILVNLDKVRSLGTSLRQRPVVLATLAGVSLAITLTLGITYQNPHIWNQVLTWDDVRFTLLRNSPLVASDTYVALRYLSGALVVMAVWTFAWTFKTQTHQTALWLWALFSFLLLATNGLVEPRYFITPAVLLLLFLRLETKTTATLIGWFLLIDLLHAPFILSGLSLW